MPRRMLRTLLRRGIDCQGRVAVKGTLPARSTLAEHHVGPRSIAMVVGGQMFSPIAWRTGLTAAVGRSNQPEKLS
jgi:hypothetical protein